MATEPIKVSENAGLIDGLTAAGRYLLVVITFTGGMLGLLETRDIAGIINYIQNNGGEALSAVLGLIALGTAGYGIAKTWFRGSQVATVAADPKVPDSVAQIK